MVNPPARRADSHLLPGKSAMDPEMKDAALSGAAPSTSTRAAGRATTSRVATAATPTVLVPRAGPVSDRPRRSMTPLSLFRAAECPSGLARLYRSTGRQRQEDARLAEEAPRHRGSRDALGGR